MKGLNRWLTGNGRTGTMTSNTERPVSRTTAGASSPTVDSAVAPTPSSSHSFESPSPSPQPATPVDSSSHINYLGLSPTRTKPINIAIPKIRTSNSASPVAAHLDIGKSKQPNRISGIDQACDSAFELGPDRDLNFDLTITIDDYDTEMTTGPALDSAFGRSRQDSFVSAGPKPISMNPNRDHGRARRESLAGSLMNGMSWGGISVGSYIKDEHSGLTCESFTVIRICCALTDAFGSRCSLLMTGTSPFAGAYQSPSFHSSSYIPKMEAEFLRHFTCCDQELETMHDLLRHYETEHTGVIQPSRAGNQMSQRIPTSRPSIANTSMDNGRQGSQGFHTQAHFSLGQQNGGAINNGMAGMGFGGMQLGGQSGMNHSAHKQSHLLNVQTNDELDAIADMEMDDTIGTMEMDDNNQRTIQQTRQMFGQQQRPQLQLNMNSTSMSQQALRTSQPSTPGATGFGFPNNPTVSSVNTPTLTTQQALGGRAGAGAHGLDDDLSTDLSANMNLNDFSGFGQDLQFFIDNPAKHLYDPSGASAQQRNLQQQMAQFGLDQSQFGDITDPHQLAVLQRAISANPAGLMIPREEDKPFKCPVIGCEKAYKNQNGLKYHKQHGHQNQQLHENKDGTFSIVNPETSAPYPGELGMEKEKPHKCEYCNKRYKNLNGLKYHKSHSPACELAAQAAGLRSAFANAANNPMSMNMANGLPGIGEDMQM
ncbi:uncharacterized protein BCR38DRAFT_415168 [Pseudomassariella vexata]|uniref:C2H2-type domain-containing protein n=1 Tax=Pseudomassariella vexata TaxID=1141098 RepID=A0A1Y2D6D5_9PEZI|nr:uncharacterized protein BCR38DRAFT_415168 [Pseudomassariella vexata]ORY54832.1 hypothetical protein BCR38DRAFT_415168 [Pseudomassariella vexata]